MLTITESNNLLSKLDVPKILNDLKCLSNSFWSIILRNNELVISSNENDFYLHEIEIIEALREQDNGISQPSYILNFENEFEAVKSLDTYANYVRTSTINNIKETWKKHEGYSNIFLVNLYNIDSYIQLVKDLSSDYAEKLRPNGGGGVAQSSTVNMAYIPFLKTFSEFYRSKKLYALDKGIEHKLNSKEPIILYGPPGTGKTFKMQEEYINTYLKENRFVTTFHQSFSYEEFVEGLKPFIPNGTKDVNYRVEPGLFYNACERAAVLAGYSTLEECLSDTFVSRKEKMKAAIDGGNSVLLCIDEINRANVSSVFGDLISLVESSKRLGAEYEMTAKLPYSKKDFGVPANLMIVGTMNTADRSIQLLDSALRRRFKFEELLPDYTTLDDNNSNTRAKEILIKLNNRIRALLDKDHQIGHSYFIKKNTDFEILEVIKENIIPLLEEYFYNETDKIRIVLNETDDMLNEDNSKKHNEEYFYVIDKEANDAIKNTNDFDDDKIIYKLNEKLSEVIDDKGAEIFLNHIIKEKESNSEQGE